MTSRHADAALAQSPLSCLIDGWSAVVLNSSTLFGTFASDFLAGRCIVINERSRDLLPLPAATFGYVYWLECATW